MALFDNLIVHTYSSSPRVATDVRYREEIVALHNALTACGLVQTSDTGQVDTSTVVRPNTQAVATTPYSVWRFDDSLQSTSPLFLKFNYGSRTTGSSWAISVEIGTGSNGAGTITHRGTNNTTILTTMLLGTTSAPADVARTSYFIAPDPHTLSVMMYDALENQVNSGFLIERFRNLSGVAIDGGAMICACGSVMSTVASTTSNIVYMAPIFTDVDALTQYAYTAGPGYVGAAPPDTTFPVKDEQVGLYPYFLGNDGKKMMGTGIAGVVHFNTHIDAGTDFETTIAGEPVICRRMIRPMQSFAGPHRTEWVFAHMIGVPA